MKDRPEIKLQAKQNFHLRFGICVLATILFIMSNPVTLYHSISSIVESLGLHGYLETIRSGETFGSNIAATILSLIKIFQPERVQIAQMAQTRELLNHYQTLMILNYLSLSFSVFLTPPILVGYSSFNLRIFRGEKAEIGDIFSDGFKNYWRKVGGILWMGLFTFLWTLALIIPGIIKMLSYFMTPFILAESEHVTATEALKLSMRMTDGHKGQIFVMALSFIGWELLSLLSLGLLGIVYVYPYRAISFAGLYDELKQKALADGTVTIEDLV